MAGEDEILRFAQDDTVRELRMMPIGRPSRSPCLEPFVQWFPHLATLAVALASLQRDPVSPRGHRKPQETTLR